METSSKKRIIILSAIGILLTSLICLFAFRNVILCHIVDKRTTRAEQTYGLQIHYQELRMKGCNEVALQGLSIVPNQRDTLLTLQSVNVKLSFWELLKGEIEVRNVLMNGLAINFIKHDSIANYDFLFFKRQQEAEPQPVIESDYANRIDRILNLIYGFLPENGQLSQINITERKDSNFVAVNIPSFIIENNHFQSTIQIKEDTLPQQLWEATGELNRRDYTLKASVFAPEKRKISLPYIPRRFGAEVTFDTLSYNMTKDKRASNQLLLKGKARVNGLDVFHKALSLSLIHI